ncbi:hypothetical protein DAPPUDRAFT_233937 [Daphnia pulex]|uniref:Uncharacterized protein n=1 Tax=Daphnia pulex TaxID=6669 RepID=E9FW54_DAPPU|nr:hypothetical protein DAPPUDRAFT_233937 [Daphnia pulex]|eukprot:EFX88983.1 hypothetical protein DAPPUDRAFT_233937 [Daphnia pulex]
MAAEQPNLLPLVWNHLYSAQKPQCQLRSERTNGVCRCPASVLTGSPVTWLGHDHPTRLYTFNGRRDGVQSAIFADCWDSLAQLNQHLQPFKDKQKGQYT